MIILACNKMNIKKNKITFFLGKKRKIMGPVQKGRPRLGHLFKADFSM